MGLKHVNDEFISYVQHFHGLVNFRPCYYLSQIAQWASQSRAEIISYVQHFHGLVNFRPCYYLSQIAQWASQSRAAP